MVLELKTTLQNYSQICDSAELDEVSDQVNEAIENTTIFLTTVTSMYNDNEGNARGSAAWRSR